jgi:hypothetical protein
MPINHNRVDVAYNVQTAADAKNSLIVHYENTNVNDRKALVSVAEETKNVLQKESIQVLADKGYHNGEQLDGCVKKNIDTYVSVPDAPRNCEIPTPDYYGDKFIYNKEKDCYTCPAGATLNATGRWYLKGNGSKYENRVKHYKTRACRTCPVKSLCTRNKNGRLIERSQYAEAVEANAKRIAAEKEKYALRQQISEHPFGIIKRQWGFDHVLMKGRKKNEAEFGLIYSAYNFMRLVHILGFTELKKRLGGAFSNFSMLWHSIMQSANRIFFPQHPAPGFVVPLIGII